MSTLLSSDPCTDIILDFIAGGVPDNQSGESSGNYNAVIGNARATDDLSKKSLREIYLLMQSLLDAGRPSTAIGRYQIIRRTMLPLQAFFKYDNHVLFTPAIQDQFAVRLLVGRGYPAWWRGTLPSIDFAHNISCEWASLPDPERDGASHYDGVGANHASTTVIHVLNMLTRARDARPAAP